MKSLQEYRIELQQSNNHKELLKEVLFYYKDQELMKEYCLLDSTSIEECYELLQNDIYLLRPVLLQKITTENRDLIYELLLKTPHYNHQQTKQEFNSGTDSQKDYDDACYLFELVHDKLSSIDFSHNGDKRFTKLQILAVVEEWKKNAKLYTYCFYLYEKMLEIYYGSSDGRSDAGAEVFVNYFRLMNMHQHSDRKELLYRALCFHKDNADLYYYYYITIEPDSINGIKDLTGLFHSDEYLKQNLLNNSNSVKKLYDYQRILFLKYSILLKGNSSTAIMKENYLKVLDRELSVDHLLLKYSLLLLQLGRIEESELVAKKCASRSTNGQVLSILATEYNLLKDLTVLLLQQKGKDYISEVFMKEYCNIDTVLKDKKITEGLQEHVDKLLMYHEVFSTTTTTTTTTVSMYENLLEIYRVLDFKTPSRSKKLKDSMHITKEDRTIVLKQEQKGVDLSDGVELQKVVEKKFGKVQEMQKRIEGKHLGFNCTFQYLKSCNDAAREGKVGVDMGKGRVVEFTIEKFNKAKLHQAGNNNNNNNSNNNKRARVVEQEQKKEESTLSKKPKSNDDFRKMFFSK